MSLKSKPSATLVLMVLATCVVSGQLFAQSRTEIIAQSGQAAPDNNGFYSDFGAPVLNDSGQAAFLATLAGTSGGGSDNTGVFRGSGGGITQIAREGQSVPDGNGTYASFLNPELNNSGQTAFFASLVGTSGGSSDNGGIFRSSGGVVTQIVRRGQSAPDGNGTFSGLDSWSINNSGHTAFWGSLAGTSGGSSDNSGIFRGNGGSITQIARKGQSAPDGNGTFSIFEVPRFNDLGQTAFRATLIGTSGGTSDNTGIFRGSGSSLTQIAREGQSVPGGNGNFSSFGHPELNNLGQAAFSAFLNGTSGGTSDNAGIYRGSGGSLTQIARRGQASPDGNGTLSNFNTSPKLNDSGQVAFVVSLSGTAGGTSDDSAIFRGSGGSLTQIVRKGQSAPDANGVFSSFSIRGLNSWGQAVISADLAGTSGGASDDLGIFTSDGIDMFRVVREGQVLGGGIVTNLDTDFRNSINEFGQIAYRASLDNGEHVIGRWTPDLHWRSVSNGTWDAAERWTLSLKPGNPHDVFIDPAASLTVTGPAANTTVRSLQIGGGNGLATLNLRNGAELTATNGVTIQTTGSLTGDGTINGNMTNNGTILANNVTVSGTLTNNSLIHGSGRIHANIVNANAGEIRALNGNTLRLTGASFSNSGLVEVHGGELRVSSLIHNNSGTGLISVRDGSLIGQAGIHNAGSISMSYGVSTLRGDIDNTGVIQVSGGAHATFFDDFTQNGVLQVATVGNTNSTVVILGDFSGSGGFMGGGDVFALGDLRPGNSPASVLYDGNLYLGASTDTFIELGGLGIGEFDQLLVTGDLNLAGDLFVSLIDGHTLGFNQDYLIADVGGSLMGQFLGLGEGDLVGNFDGFDLFISYAANGGSGISLFTAVPEPGAGVLALLAASVVLRRSRQARHAHSNGISTI